MQVKAVQINNIKLTNNNKQNHYIKNTNITTDVFVKNTSPNFKGYQQDFENAMNAPIKNKSHAEVIFEDLCKSIKAEPRSHKNYGTFLLEEYPVEKLIQNLRVPKPWSQELMVVEIAKEKKQLPLYFKEGQALVSLKIDEPYDMLDFIAKDYSIMNPKIVFQDIDNKKRTIEFGMDEDEHLIIDREYDRYTFWENGKPKTIATYDPQTEIYEEIYYKKDGSKDFWKNLFS